MAYPNPPMNIAGTYQQGQTIRQTNIDAAATIEQAQRRSDTMYLTEKARLTKIGMSIFGDTMKKMSEDIAYATGGYLLDQNIQMKKLDVAAAVQERLSDEAVSAGALISFNPGPNPDQALQEVQDISNRSKSASQGAPAGREGSTFSGPPAPRPGEDGSSYVGVPEPSEDDRRTEFVTRPKGQGAPAVKSGQGAEENITSVKQRGSTRSQRPAPPQRPQHTRIGTTEIFGNPTTGGMYARTAKGLVVPISDSTFRNLIGLQQSNAEIHAFNEMANYEHSLSKWVDALTSEQLASQSAVGETIVEGHLKSGAIDEGTAAMLRDAVEAGVAPEELVKIINSMKKSGTSAGLEVLAKARSNTHKARAAHNKGIETETKKQLVAIDEKLAALDMEDPVERSQAQELKARRIGIQNKNDRARYAKGIRDNLGAYDSYIPRSITQLDESTINDMFNLSVMEAGVQGNSEAERLLAYRGLLQGSGAQEWVAKTMREYRYLHTSHGLVYTEDSERRFLNQIGRHMSETDKVSQELIMRKLKEQDAERAKNESSDAGSETLSRLGAIGNASFINTPQGSFFKAAMEAEHADAKGAFDALMEAGIDTYGSNADVSVFPPEIQDAMFQLMQEFEPGTNTED